MAELRVLKLTTHSKKILVIAPSWVGDMVMTQSLFMTLKRHQPPPQIDVLAPAWSLPLLNRMPEVTKAIAMPIRHGQFKLKQRMQIGKQLRDNRYDQSITLPNSWKSALIPFFANIPLRTGYIGEARWGLLNDARKLDKKKLTMTVQRFVALGQPESFTSIPKYAFPQLHIEANNQQQVCEKFSITTKERILALCPGAEYGPAKRWPADHFAELAKQKLQESWQIWLFGSDKDKMIAYQINQLTNNACQDFSGKTTLAEAVDLMSLSDVVVSNDSGLMHVAAALNKKVIAIYGSSDPDFTPPLSEKAKIINLKLECSPCFQRQCPLQHTHCLTQITPQQVMAQFE